MRTGSKIPRRLSSEPGAALFKLLRIRLTLWYSGVVGGALLVFGIALYFGAQYMLFTPIQDDLAEQASIIALQWQNFPSSLCNPLQLKLPIQIPHWPSTHLHSFQVTHVIACIDTQGRLFHMGSSNGEEVPTTFLNTSLLKISLQKGHAVDIVDGGSAYGRIYRYALTVTDTTHKKLLGVLMVGQSVATQDNALTILLTLLLSMGAITLLGSGLGGLFLANRALLPARLAFVRQQRFIADASHELRTPLTLLSADAEVLLNSSSQYSEEDRNLLEDIFSEAQHMANLASSMLALARLDMDDQHRHREHDIINLVEVSKNVVHRATALANQHHVTLHNIHIENAVPVIADATLLEQAILILLDNAIKYNRYDGSVTLRAYASGSLASLEICDTGIGIAPEHLPHLGERFYRIDKARSREAGGTGLGLSIARSIAKAHSGTLSITSIPEQGTTVTLTFPSVL